METFSNLKDFVDNPHFHNQRKKSLFKLDIESIDVPIVDLIDPEYIQFGCAEWFWEKQANSYVLQVEPKRHMTKERLSVDCWEALHLKKIRNNFFSQLNKLVQDLIDSRMSDYHNSF